ncbi:PAS domain S-box protein [Paraburkholderia sabiae]|uniref:histidine kinase n=1 Tax=Paraburkholderia sabiae TaxID=273251 RepID=A0ABU9QSE0_9BURK|nr:PAS domain S-box protein [Paraburkholderia sabiae]WJZ72215.1 PAS domain S-box protein [Paraburkholderia sabiae]CAD6562904.1 Sensor histidine kinase RcsC [Paraburkholderia sabiae]
MHGDENNIQATWPSLLIGRISEYAIFRLTERGEVASWNPGAKRIKGYEADEIIGRHFSVFYTDGDRRNHVPEQVLRKAREQGQHDTEGWRVRKDGTKFWASILVTALYTDTGAFVGFGKVVRDTTDKRLAYEAVTESERRFRLLVQGVTDYAIFMLSPEGLVTNWNLGAARIKGYQANEVIGAHFRQFYTPEDAALGLPERGLHTAAIEGRFETEGWRVRKDGTRFWANVIIDAIRDETGELIGFAKITRDVTERKTAQEQLEKARVALLQSQKMEALGKLTGGVAHDFNNVLQVLRGNLELLEGRHGRDAWTQERLYKAIEAVEHGATLASQLLAFGRRQALQPVVVNLAVMLRSMDDLLRRALGEVINVETVIAGGLWNTLVDPNHLENVVLNLAINARDAMPEGGKLTLELSNAMLDEHYTALADDVRDGQYVLLAVTDTGTGMSREIMERAFEPFFTTKPEGQGTGLGLSMAYGFIKQSGGHVRIYSEPGHGTTVKVYLPRSMAEAVDLEPPEPVALAGGAETILVVEDDRRVQVTVLETLRQLGYTVLKADDAQSALAIVQSGMNIDLLFTDVVMPGTMRSTELAKRATLMLPHLKVLFTSGYTQNAIVHGGRLDPGVHLLSKPYSREQLASKIRRLLGPAGASDADAAVASPSPPSLPSQPSYTPPDLTVLVVDDDNGSREAVNELLTTMGYDVHEAADAEAAMRVLMAEKVDVLLTDITLPGQSGIELARVAVGRNPDIRVIFVSGGNTPTPEEVGFGCASLGKPFTGDQLHALIRAMHGRRKQTNEE